MANEESRPRRTQSGDREPNGADEPTENLFGGLDQESDEGDASALGDDASGGVAVPEPPRLQAVPDLGSGEREPPPNQEFFIPIHTFVRLTPREVRIVDHPAFQRLGDVHQLGQTYVVYRGATHRRHEHALGTLHVAQMMIDALGRNAEAERKPDDAGAHWKPDKALQPAEIAFVRLGALLHDVGHIPAGHTFEDELGLFPKHDSLERLGFILGRETWLGSATPPLGELIDELYRPLIEATGFDVAPHELLLALIASDYEGVRVADALADNPQFRLRVCRDLIGNTICADLLDYLHRDWHHLGKHKQFDTRLIDYMEIRRDDHNGEAALVVYLRGGDRVRNDAVSAILDLLESRYQLYEMGLYHRTKLAASAMLERAVAELADALGEVWLNGLPELLLDCSDSEMLSALRGAAAEAAEGSGGEGRVRLGAAADLVISLRQRRLHKKLYQRFRNQFTTAQASHIEQLYAYSASDGGDRRAPGRRRLQALRQLEQDFELRPLSLTMYCPPAHMSTKVADVSILLDEEVHSLDEHERRDERLTGGHLGAQQARFSNLWHVYFSCEEKQFERLKERRLYPLLIDAIDCFVLGIAHGPVRLEERALTIAQSIANAPSSPWQGREVVDDILVARRGSETTYYPDGLPALRYLYKS